MSKKFGFGHVNTYARKTSSISKGRGNKWSAKNIFKEASRDEENSPHVLNPQPPVQVVANTDIHDMADALEAFAASHKSVVIDKNGIERERSIRSDQHMLIAAVYSWPEGTDNFDEEKANEYFAECLKFHEKKFGKIENATVHFDESHPHMHVYSFSTNAKMSHPGYAAKAKFLAENSYEGLSSEQKKAKNKEANDVYKEAMRGFQDELHEQVYKKFGMDRLGPARQRLSRKGWLERKKLLEEKAQLLQSFNSAKEKVLVASTANEKKSKELIAREATLKERERNIKSQETALENKIKDAEKKINEADSKEKAIEGKIKEIEAAGGLKNWLRKTGYKMLGEKLPEIAALERERDDAVIDKKSAWRDANQAIKEKDAFASALRKANEEINAVKNESDVLRDEIESLKNKQRDFDDALQEMTADKDDKIHDLHSQNEYLKARLKELKPNTDFE